MTTQHRATRRKLPTIFITAALLAVGVATLAPPASATSVWTVCPGGSCSFTTIQGALAAATDGDTILVAPGTYAGPISITRSVTLCSAPLGGFWCDPSGVANTVIRGGGLYPVWIGADFVTLQGFTIENPNEAAVDSAFGPVDPSLVVVFGDGVQITDNILQNPAAAPLPGQTRWYTVGINIGTGSDLVTIERNVLRNFVPGIAPGGMCPTAPCKVVGILNWGRGSGMRVTDTPIDLSGTSIPATGIGFDRNGVVHVYSNTITMPGSPAGSAPLSIGIDGGISTFAQVGSNVITTETGGSPFGLYGIYGIWSKSEFLGNRISNMQHGIMLRSSAVGENRVAGNFFSDGNQGLLNFARMTEVENDRFTNMARGVVLDRVAGDPTASKDVVLFGNTFTRTTNPLHITDTLSGLAVNARYNDWGVYTRDQIETVNTDDGANNVVDVSCFIDSDGVTPVCPIANIGRSTLNNAWPREVRYSDLSIERNRPIVSRSWTLPGSATSTNAVVTQLLGPGTYTVALNVTDSEGFNDTDSLTFALTNAAPTLSAPATLGATEGTLFTLPLTAGDADGDRLTFSMTGAPAGATLHATTGVFKWTPGYDQDGASYAIVFSVTDGLATATASSTLTVSDTPVAPILTPLGTRAVLEEALVSVTVTASDPNGGIVALVDGGLPAGATFVDHGDNTGSFAWTPPLGSAGTYTVSFTATAANGLTDTKDLIVSVGQQASLTLARVGSYEAVGSPGEVITVHASLVNTGAGTDTFTLTATSASPAGAWTRVLPADPTLASGATHAIDFTIEIPATGGISVITLKVCSQAQLGICKSVTWRASTPLKLVIYMEPEFSLSGDVPRGTAIVTWLNGAPAVNAHVELSEQTTRGITLSSTAAGNTNGTGRFDFTFSSPTAKLPGSHRVYGLATRTGVPPSSAEDAYTVGV